MIKRLFYSLVIYAVCIPMLFAESGTKQVIGRFAMIVGANYGGPDRDKLRYAVSDATAMQSILSSMGGVRTTESVILLEPDRRIFFSGIRKLYKTVTQAKKTFRKVEIIFYYSGHSDEEGLLLGNNKVYYKELRTALDKIPADIKIAILDSCSSGAFARAKGGKIQSPFLMDMSYDMKGYAYMTSSSKNEVSQESDLVKGSFFTHYLMLGLRGAADVNQDGRISLNEAYQYAFRETLSRTEKTMNGAQHPNYHIQMTGTGDIVLTDLKKSSTSLVFHKSIQGKISIRDEDDMLVAEFKKPYGRDITIGLEHGAYKVLNNRDGKLYEARVKIVPGSPYLLRNSIFSGVDREYATARGGSTKQNINNDKYIVASLRNLNHSGYGAPVMQVTRIADRANLLLGLRAGWLINNQVVIGIAGYGLVSPMRYEEMSGVDDPEDRRIGMGYGGVLFEYYFFKDHFINVAVGLLVGAGGFGLGSKSEDTSSATSYSQDNTGGYSYDRGDGMFVAEHSVTVYFNITRFFRIGFGGAYRYFNGGKILGVEGKDFSGFSGTVSLAFGWF